MLLNTVLKFDFVGEAGIFPRLGRLSTENTIAEVITNNYLKPLKQEGFAFYNGDFVFCKCSDGSIIGTVSVSGEDVDITQISP